MFVLVHSKGKSLIFTAKTKVRTDDVTDVKLHNSDCQDTGTGSTPAEKGLTGSAAVSLELHTVDHAERNDYVKRLVKVNINDQGLSALLITVSFCDIYKFNSMRDVCVS